MNLAQRYIDHFYREFPGRVPFKAGSAGGFSFVYPFVFENNKGIPIGLVCMAWEKGSSENLVRIFHISSFKSGRGNGSEILTKLCKVADDYKVNLTLQAEPQSNGLEIIEINKLVSWYQKFGFIGNCIMHRYAGNT